MLAPSMPAPSSARPSPTSLSSPGPLPQSPRTYYDVCFFLPGQSAFRQLECGVLLNQDIIAWTQDERTSEAELADIVAVHLSSNGRRVVVDRCAITFSDNNVLTVVNSDGGGYYDSEHAKSYRAFVADLHRRLASGPHGAIRFTAGWTQSRYTATLVAAYAGVAASVIIGLAFYLMLHNYQGLVIVTLGTIGNWRLERMTRANAPRDYTPDNLPAELMT
jgi:hypothetical protein